MNDIHICALSDGRGHSHHSGVLEGLFPLFLDPLALGTVENGEFLGTFARTHMDGAKSCHGDNGRSSRSDEIHWSFSWQV